MKNTYLRLNAFVPVARSVTLLITFCLLLTALSASSAQTVSSADDAADTARQALDAWLEAFNSGERAQLDAFRERWNSKMDVDEMLAFRNETGGFRLVRYEAGETGVARALLQEQESDIVARLEMVVKPNEPTFLRILAIDPPDDLRVARLTQQGAIDALVAKADEQAEKDAFAGVILVAKGDELLLQRAWGLADRAADTPVSLDTKFRIGSMNKMFTAVATLQLVEAGKLSLDGTVGQYLPEYPNADVAKVTIRQLLTHSGGTGDIFGPEFDDQRSSLKTHDDYVRLYGKRGLEHAPGTEQRYSNYGFLLLGAIIEKITRQSYYEYIEEHVFAPAGMSDSGSLPEDVSVPGRAVAYTRTGGRWVDAADTLPYRGTAAGGGYSTADDLLKFARALLAGKLLSADMLSEATRDQTPWYGYGFNVREQEGVWLFGHGGGAEGMNGDLRIYPALGVVTVALANLDPPAVERLVNYYHLRMPMPAADAK